LGYNPEDFDAWVKPEDMVEVSKKTPSFKKPCNFINYRAFIMFNSLGKLQSSFSAHCILQLNPLIDII
jgi:hypothetical protein